ncbi:MAG: hypothetical protein ACAH83_00525 [Alphaproteobacteria bacterium]
MAAGKFFSALRNAFSRAVHFENADDRARKGAVADAILEHSLKHVENADIDYAMRLRRVLMSTRTRHLEVLLEKNVAVVIDRRLSGLKAEGNEDHITGAFYDRADGRVATLWDDNGAKGGFFFGSEAAHFGPVMLEKLATELQAGKKGDLYAARYVYGDPITMSVAVMTKWVQPHETGKVMERYPALKAPPSKPLPPPKF